MLKSLAMLAALAMAVAPTPSYADGTSGPGNWTRIETAEGCVAFWKYRPRIETEAEFHRNSAFSFKGGCAKGKLINGRGTLIWRRMNLSAGNPDQHLGFEGMFVDGLLEGVALHTWDGRDFGQDFYTRGCGRNEQSDGDCEPFSGSPSSLAFEEEPTANPSQPTFASTTPTAQPSASPGGSDVFDQCVKLQSMGRSGIQMMWRLHNVCDRPIKLSHCYRSLFSAAGDPNLCMRLEYRTDTIAAGGTFEFPFTLAQDGSAYTDGRVAKGDKLEVIGHACANGNAPTVGFENKQFLFYHC